MSFNLRSILTICISLFTAFSAVAQDNECIDFDDDIESGVYGQASNYMPGATLFTDDGVKVTLDSFLYFNGSKDLLNVTITDDDLFGGNTGDLLDDEYAFISNVNMVFDFTSLSGSTTEVCFNFVDGGGEENIAVNGQPIRVLQNFLEIDGEEIAPGVIVNLQLSNTLNFPAGTLCLKGNVKTLLVGGQEFAMDELCFKTDDDDDDDDDERCAFEDFTMSPKPCTPNGVFFATANFRTRNGGSGFFIEVGDQSFGPFSYTDAEAPQVGPLRADGSVYVFTIRDKDNPDCKAVYRLQSENCSNSNCPIRNPLIDLRFCDDDDDDEEEDDACLFINFDNLPTVIVNFVLYINGERVGQYASSDLPLTIDTDDLPDTDDRVIEVKICVANIPDCCFSKTIRLPNDDDDDDDDDDCRIKNLTARPSPCDSNGQVFIKIDFEYDDVSEKFVLWQNGNEIGTYAYADLPIRIGPYDGNTDQAFEFKVFDAEEDDCYAETRLEGLNCGSDYCTLGEIVLTDLECISNTEYRVTIDVRRQTSSTTFKLKTRGGYEATIGYERLPLRLALPIPVNSRTDEIKITDSNDPECYTKREVVLPCLNSCELGEGSASDIECLNDQRYRVTINFRHNNRRGNFTLKSRGGFEATFSYSALPLRLALPLTGEGFDEVKIQDQDDPNCYTYIEYRTPCDNDDCRLGSIRIRDLECTAAGVYRAIVDFSHNNRDGGFILRTRSGFEARYRYSDLPVRFSSRLTNSGMDEIKIQDIDDPDCTISREFEIDCSSNNCNITDLRVKPVDCTDDKFWLQVSFRAQDAGASGYFVFVDGQIFGPFDYNNSQRGPVVGPFEKENDNVYKILLIDIDNPACYAYAELRDIECDDDDDDCQISNLEASVGDCNDNGTFDLKVNFLTTSAADRGFDVLYQNRVVGTFRLSQLPVTVSLPALTTGTSPEEVITVCLRDDDDDDDDDFDCCRRASFNIPNCIPQPECRIGELRTEVSDCNNEGLFFVKLNFAHEGTGRGFKITSGNGAVFGEFSYEQLPLELGPFRGDGETSYQFVVQDLENENCLNRISLEPVACTVEVWPGDANANNRADHFDLLNIGIAFGAQGPARANRSIAWQGFNALLWNQTFDNGANYAHADANGDGVVDFTDKEAIAQNYGLTNGNGIEPVPQLPGTDIDPPIFVDLPNNGNLPSGLAFSVPIILGTSDNFIEDLYGIAFTIDFDPTIIDPASIEISYPKSWLGEENTNLITFDRVDQERGEIHIAITRIDQTNASGFGSVALVSGIIDDIAGRIIGGDIEIKNVYAINTLHRRIPLHTWKQRIQIKSQDEVPGRIDLRRNVRIIPNPTSDLIQVYTPYATPVESIQLLDAQGKPVRQPVQNTDTISLGDVPQGIYMLRIKIGEHIIHERVVKM